MKSALDKKEYNRGKTLKDFFKELKLHQKILLVATYSFGLVQFARPICMYIISAMFILDPTFSSVDTIGEFICDYFLMALIYWGDLLLPPVVMIMNIISLKMRKFSYLLCLINVVIVFFCSNIGVVSELLKEWF